MYCKQCGARLVDDARFCHECGAKVCEGETQVQDLPAVQGPPVPWDDAPAVLDDAPAQGPSLVASTSTADKDAAPRPRRKGAVTVLFAILGILLSVVGEVVGAVCAALFGADMYLCGLVGSCVGAALGVCAMGGARLLDLRCSSVAAALRMGWWVIAVSLFLVANDAYGTIASGAELRGDWFVRAWYALALCACIGFSEETMFRGLLFGGLLDCWGKDRRGIVKAVLVSCLLFGAAHIEWWSVDYGDPAQLAQAVLKVVQTGMFGFLLAAMTLRTKSVIGPALVHGLSNFVIFFYSYALMGEELDVSYVSSGVEGMETIVAYVVVIALYVPLVVKGIRMLRDAPVPDYGAFHSER